MSRLLPCTLALLLSIAPAAARESASATIEHEIPLPPGTQLRVENLLGSITVISAERSGSALVEARVVAEADSDGAARRLAEGVAVQSIGDGWIRLEPPRDDEITGYRMPRSESDGLVSRWVTPFLKRKGSEVPWAGGTVVVGNAKGAAAVAVHVTVTVPYDVDAAFLQAVGSIHGAGLRGRFDLESIDGAQLVEQLYGTLSARTVGGRIDVRQLHGGELTLDTVSGTIGLTEVTADEARLRTVEGLIEGSGVSIAALRVDTESGDVRLDDVEPAELELHTDSGDVDVGTQLRRARAASIRSGSGDVTLRLGRLVPFDLAVETDKGSVKTKGLAVEVVENGALTTVRRGDGGARLEIATLSGSIGLRPL